MVWKGSNLIPKRKYTSFKSLKSERASLIQIGTGSSSTEPGDDANTENRDWWSSNEYIQVDYRKIILNYYSIHFLKM